jgi:hypothetical protein
VARGRVSGCLRGAYYFPAGYAGTRAFWVGLVPDQAPRNVLQYGLFVKVKFLG